jgi:extracellular factor (EF) 3-hydroxypalmitic acid methyl ester biosynthesis protein
MYNQRFFDQALGLMEQGYARAAVPLLVGHLFHAYSDSEKWPEVKKALLDHPVHQRLMEDPYSRHAASQPRGYPGDALLIDLIYDQQLTDEVTPIGAELFSQSIAWQASEGVRQRRVFAQGMVEDAHKAGQAICVLACGHFREGDPLIGKDCTNITAVDQDPLSLERVRQNHPTINACEANVIRFLRQAAQDGHRFDLIYTLGLTDYLDDRAMALLHGLMKQCLAPGGRIVVANFLPDHLAKGWMDAVMNWQLIYRSEDDLAGFASEIGLIPRTWTDSTGSIAYCEMKSV